MLRKTPSYFSVVSLILLILVIVGFASRAIFFPDRLPPGRLTLYIHIIVTGGWFVLLLLQTALISVRKHKLHMQLGRYSIGLGIAIFISGIVMVIENNMREFLWIQVVSNSMNMITFAILFGMGIQYRRKLPFHKRMMIFASLAMMSPALARLSDALIGNPILATPIWLALLASVPIYDWVSEQKINRASIIGIGVNLSQLVAQIGTVLLTA